jgi:hypothetical protein
LGEGEGNILGREFQHIENWGFDINWGENVHIGEEWVVNILGTGSPISWRGDVKHLREGVVTSWGGGGQTSCGSGGWINILVRARGRWGGRWKHFVKVWSQHFDKGRSNMLERNGNILARWVQHLGERGQHLALWRAGFNILESVRGVTSWGVEGSDTLGKGSTSWGSGPISWGEYEGWPSILGSENGVRKHLEEWAVMIFLEININIVYYNITFLPLLTN